MKKILLTGKEGQIGWELRRTLSTLGDVLALNRKEFDLNHPVQMRKVIQSFQPHIIVNAAAYTAVDEAERDKEKAFAINAQAVELLAQEAKKLNSLLIHYSTDYVFDGQSTTPYTEEDVPSPFNFYGESKLAGEKAIEKYEGRYLIFRTSWIFGQRGKNFLQKIVELAQKLNTLKIVGDQIGCPTWSRLVAEATAQILTQNLEDSWGVYHMTCRGEASWFEFAEAILKMTSSLATVEKITSAQYPTLAKRPSYSVLDNNKLHSRFNIHLPHWKKGLELCHL